MIGPNSCDCQKQHPNDNTLSGRLARRCISNGYSEQEDLPRESCDTGGCVCSYVKEGCPVFSLDCALSLAAEHKRGLLVNVEMGYGDAIMCAQVA